MGPLLDVRTGNNSTVDRYGDKIKWGKTGQRFARNWPDEIFTRKPPAKIKVSKMELATGTK